MEEPCGCRKFHFPGYDGALPKSTRTSRGRRAYARKIHKSSEMNCIDLLATVAGQVLKAKNLRQDIVETQSASSNETSSFNLTARSYLIDFSLNQGEHSDVQEKTTIGGVARPVYSQGSINNIQEAFGKDLGNNTKWADFPCNKWHMQNTKSRFLAYPTEVGAEAFNDDDVSDVKLEWKEDISFQIISPELPQPNRLNSSLQTEDLNKQNAECGSFEGTHVINDSSCMTLVPDDVPQPPSISSRKDTTIHVHKQLSRLCSEKPLESYLDFSQDLARFKAKDDDDNFPNLVVPETTLPLRQVMPSFENTGTVMDDQEKSQVHANDVLGTVALRKGSVTDGCLPCVKHCSAHQFKERKRKRILERSKVVTDCPLDFDAKDTSVGSSPTTNKASRRNMQRNSNEAHDCSPVKVNITSFRVPELCINLPETATVASLKRAVMEAAVDLLGGGLHVRVLHHGKKIHDENSTLIQMGIACKDRMDSLAFMLEPTGVSKTSIDVGDSFISCPSGKGLNAACYPVFTSGNNHEGIGKKALNGSSNVDALMDVSNKKDEVQLKAGAPQELPTPATAALILHTHGEGDMSVDLMASHPNHVSFGGKRRSRRPFSVVEVEALVQAVELLGTGRWREVKQQVFSNARHRTYVDLKDKWKTLVHTARIAPHQRRGEQVPQELLDRVLQAHTYWAMLLAKQQEDIDI